MKEYQTFPALVSDSGFGREELSKLPTGPQEIWDAYLAVHKDAKEFQYKTLPNYDELHIVYVTSGAYPQSCGLDALEDHRSQYQDYSTDDATEAKATSPANMPQRNLAPLSPIASTPSTISRARDEQVTGNVREGKRKRSSRNEIADALRLLAKCQLELAAVRKESHSSVMQLAILDFNMQFAARSPRSKIKFTRHIVLNPNEVEMYNELDAKVKIEYVADDIGDE